MAKIECPECGSPMILKRSLKYTNRDGTPRRWYGCSRWPECDGAHGAHPDGRPLGVPARKDVKVARMETHRQMDAWADKMGYDTKQCYAAIGRHFGCEVHIGELDISGCENLQRFFKEAPND